MLYIIIMDIIVFGKPIGKALLDLGRFRRLNKIIASLLLLLVSSSSWAGTITIGQTSVLTTADGGNANLLLAQSATLSQTATIQSISFYVTAAAGKLVLGIYAIRSMAVRDNSWPAPEHLLRTSDGTRNR